MELSSHGKGIPIFFFAVGSHQSWNKSTLFIGIDDLWQFCRKKVGY